MCIYNSSCKYVQHKIRHNPLTIVDTYLHQFDDHTLLGNFSAQFLN